MSVQAVNVRRFPGQVAAASLLIALAAMPLRVQGGFGPFASVSLLDLFIASAAALFGVKALASGRLATGHRGVFFCLFVPVFVSVLSLVWAADLSAAVRTLVPYLFALAAYLVAVNVFGGLPSGTLMRLMAAFVPLCLVASAFAYAGVPGFGFFLSATDELTRAEQLNRLASIYTRLSHPFIGLSNDYAAVLSFVVFPLAAWAWLKRSRVCAAAAALAAGAVVLTLSRGSVLAMAVFGLLFLLRMRGVQATFLNLSMAAAAVAGAFLLLSGATVRLEDRVIRMDDVLGGRLSSGVNLENRAQDYRGAVGAISDGPWLGYGVGSTANGSRSPRKLAVHSTYLQQALFFGIPLGGIVSMALLALPVIFFRWPSRSREARTMASAFGFTMGAELLSFAAETTFEATVPRILLHMMLGLSVALLVSLDAEEAAT